MRKFTRQEDQFILDNYLKIPMKRISKLMNRPEASARQRLIRLGYRVPKEIAQRFAKESQIKVGSISHNKGKKMPDHVREKVKRTWYTKGHIPHTVKRPGTITQRPDKTGRIYFYICEETKKWDALHRYVWRQHYGPIPKGMNVAFKDGNTKNCTIENLELITKQENMQRNTIHNLPESIRNTKLLIGSLNRKINNHVKNHQ